VAQRVWDAFDRYPFNSPWIRGMIGRYWLVTWFFANSGLALVHSASDTSLLFFDARLYLDAIAAWLQGRDPWAVQLAGNFFAAPPPSLLPLAPIAILPRDVGVAVVASSVIVAAVASVRLLRLPWWWIMFPPLVQSILSANIHALVLPLVLVGWGALAVPLKLYAAIPLLVLGRWRSLWVAAIAIGVTVPFLPWGPYVTQFELINARLMEQTRHALPTPVLIAMAPIALLSMWIVGRERAAWLAIPALWPSQQYYYGSLAIGARNGLAAALVALPINGSGLIALVVLALVIWHRDGPPALPAWRSRPPRGTIEAVAPSTGPLDSEP